MTKTLMQRNRERIAKVREENLKRKHPSRLKMRDDFTMESGGAVLLWEDRGAKEGIVVTVQPKTEK